MRGPGAAELSPVERDALRDIIYTDLRLLLAGNHAPGHPTMSEISDLPKPERAQAMLTETIARVAAIADLSHLLDQLGWEPEGSAEPMYLYPTPAAARALRYCRQEIEDEGKPTTDTDKRIAEETDGELNGALELLERLHDWGLV